MHRAEHSPEFRVRGMSVAITRSPQQKTVIVPAEMGALVGSIAGIGELVGLARDQQTNRPTPPSPPAGRRSSVPRSE